MTATEDQLRDALHGIAELVHERPAPETGPTPRAWFSGWFGPAAVAAAVVVVIVIGAITATVMRGTDKYPAFSGRSRFVIGLVAQGNGPAGDGASVRDARTGRVISLVRLAAGIQRWIAVSATADDRIFFLSGLTDKSTGVVYKLALRDDGRVGRLTEVPGTRTEQHIRFIAATRDGTRVALTIDREPPSGSLDFPPRGGGLTKEEAKKARDDIIKNSKKTYDSVYGPARIDVVTVATGRRETFQSTSHGLIGNLSWSDNGRRLAFDYGGASSPGPQGGIWVVEPAAGRDLFAGGWRLASNWRGPISPILSADGSTLFVIGNSGKPSVTRLYEVDVKTHREVRTLLERPFTDSGENAGFEFTTYARDPRSGELLVIQSAGPTEVEGTTRRSTTALRIDPRTASTSVVDFPGGWPHDFAW